MNNYLIKFFLFKIRRFKIKKDFHTLYKILKNFVLTNIRKLRFILVGILYGKIINPNMVQASIIEYFYDNLGGLNDNKDLNKLESIYKEIANDIKPFIEPKELTYLNKYFPTKVFSIEDYIFLERLKYRIFKKIGLYKEIIPKLNLLLHHLRINCISGDIFQYSQDKGIINLSRGWGGSIGHLGHFSRYLQAKKLGLLLQDKYRLYLPQSNSVCHIDNWNFLGYLERAALNIPGIELDFSKKNYLYDLLFPCTIQMDIWDFKSGPQPLYRALNFVDTAWSTYKYPPFLKLDDKHFERGQHTLREMGVSTGGWFIAIHVRNNLSPLANSQSARNADVNSYLPAIREICRLGGYVILMGDKDSKKLAYNIQGCFDYAHSSYKSEWMDVFLWAKCRFFVGTLSGPLEIPPLFGRPALLTNAPCFGSEASVMRTKTIMMPKLYYDCKKLRHLTFSEILDSPIGWSENHAQLDDIVLEDNKCEDISNAILEMLELTDHSKDYDEEVMKISNSEEMIKISKIRNDYNAFGNAPLPYSFLKKYDNLIC